MWELTELCALCKELNSLFPASLRCSSYPDPPVCSVQASEELLKEHYISLRDRPFYGRLVKYMSSGPVVAMVSPASTPCTEEQG